MKRYSSKDIAEQHLRAFLALQAVQTFNNRQQQRTEEPPTEEQPLVITRDVKPTTPFQAAKPFLIGAAVLLGLSVAAALVAILGPAVLLPALGLTAATLATTATIGIAVGSSILCGLLALALAIKALTKANEFKQHPSRTFSRRV